MRSWNTLDQEALEIMANFYFRSFISMMQRELEHQEEENRSIALYGGEGKSESAIKKEIIEKSQQEMQTDLYRLLRGHVSRKGKVAKILFTPLAEGKLEKTYQRVKVIRYVKSHWSGLFMRLKQHR